MNFQKHSNLSKYSILVLVLSSVLFLVACGSTPTTTIDDVKDSEAVVIREGIFEDADASHKGSGNLSILQKEDKLTVRFENFLSTNGPDLKVILVEKIEGTNSSSIGNKEELGPLKSTNGNQNYDVPEGVDLSKFTGVMIYCKQFGVVFSRAAFK